MFCLPRFALLETLQLESLSSCNKNSKSAYKPGSVWGNHSSRLSVTAKLKQPTRRQRGPRQCLPIWSCSKWGLPSHIVLPRARCALTAPFHHHHASLRCVRLSLSVALSVGSHRPGVTWHFALWSPDFPRYLAITRLPSGLDATLARSALPAKTIA
jgi:hypothetical protein